MTLFEKLLPEYLEANLMPRNKKELAEFCKGLFAFYQRRRGELSQSKRNLQSEEAKEMAKKAVQKRRENKMKKD